MERIHAAGQQLLDYLYCVAGDEAEGKNRLAAMIDDETRQLQLPNDLILSRVERAITGLNVPYSSETRQIRLPLFDKVLSRLEAVLKQRQQAVGQGLNTDELLPAQTRRIGLTMELHVKLQLLRDYYAFKVPDVDFSIQRGDSVGMTSWRTYLVMTLSKDPAKSTEQLEQIESIAVNLGNGMGQCFDLPDGRKMIMLHNRGAYLDPAIEVIKGDDAFIAAKASQLSPGVGLKEAAARN